MEDGFAWKATSKEECNCAWGLIMETLEVLQNRLVMLVKNTNLSLGKNKR